MNENYTPAKKSFENEKKAYQILNPHPNIVSFFSATQTTINSDKLCILLLENCPKGSLFDIIKLLPANQFQENQIIRIIYEISLGLLHIHK